MAIMTTPDEVRQLMEDDACALLLDVRDAGDYAQGHIPHAESLPFEAVWSSATADDLEAAGLAAIARKRGLAAGTDASTVVVYCYQGVLSARAADKLERFGYACVRDAGGILNWPYSLER